MDLPPSRKAKADLFLKLHDRSRILVLPNAWDVGSAKALAALPGCRALATTSGGMAASLGFEDGERTPVEVMVSACARIASAVEVPVTADLEHCYQVMECDDSSLLDAWMAAWSDLVAFEVHPVLTSAEAAAASS